MPLSLLSASVKDGYAGTFLYTNPQTEEIPQQKIMLKREITLLDSLWERITVQNFHSQPANCHLRFKFQSDFADIFEVRGLNLAQRGLRMIPQASADGQAIFLAYRGKDNVLLETKIEFNRFSPDKVRDGEVEFFVQLPVLGQKDFEFHIATLWGGASSCEGEAGVHCYEDAYKAAEDRFISWRNCGTAISTDKGIFDLAIERGFRDIYILRQPTPKGWGLAAGVPWYCAVFGRDSAITASQLLPFHPELARECIAVMAAYQGQKHNFFSREEPGRILHELRLGELSRTGQIPHSPYFGTVDATQLWLQLICEYVNWTGDIDFAKDLWPRIKLATAWLEKACEPTGYLTYESRHSYDLTNQGWKDSGDSIMHEDGQLAAGPIAVCEAQGYLYAAHNQLALLAEALNDNQFAEHLKKFALDLKKRFLHDFWIEGERYVALALDGSGSQVQVVSSNPGHLLYTGILENEKAQMVADRLMSEDLHSGWGIRTLARSAIAYNPMSYHNGSVWPHDNAIIAEGMRKIGRLADAHKILHSVLSVAQRKQDFRLPELFCGFPRAGSEDPIDYPVSCLPQAWAAGSLFQLLKACINFQPDLLSNKLRIIDPALPDWMKKLMVSGLRAGSSTLDLLFKDVNGTSSCQILRKNGPVRVIIET